MSVGSPEGGRKKHDSDKNNNHKKRNPNKHNYYRDEPGHCETTPDMVKTRFRPGPFRPGLD